MKEELVSLRDDYNEHKFIEERTRRCVALNRCIQCIFNTSGWVFSIHNTREQPNRIHTKHLIASEEDSAIE